MTTITEATNRFGQPYWAVRWGQGATQLVICSTRAEADDNGEPPTLRGRRNPQGWWQGQPNRLGGHNAQIEVPHRTRVRAQDVHGQHTGQRRDKINQSRIPEIKENTMTIRDTKVRVLRPRCSATKWSIHGFGLVQCKLRANHKRIDHVVGIRFVDRWESK